MAREPALPAPNASRSVKKELTVLNAEGLHARPAAEFARCALAFRSSIQIHIGGRQYQARRIIDVLLAKLDCGSTFILEAHGPDAQEAVTRIEKLLQDLKENDGRRFTRKRDAGETPD